MKIKVKKEMKKEEVLETVKYDTLLTEEGEFKTLLSRTYLHRKAYKPLNSKLVVSAIPGTIIKLYTAVNETVNEGDILLELDAMKMYNKILAPIGGKIKAIYVKEGERVPKNFIMVEFE